MKKLEDIPKKEIFKVPDDYFENLPERIRKRIDADRTSSETNFVYRYKLQYVMPVILLVAAGVSWFTTNKQPRDIETILASIDTRDLVAYIDETDLNAYDLLDNVALTDSIVLDVESEVYQLRFDDETLDGLIENFDLENL